MTLTDQVIKNIITRVVKSEDYRIEIVNLINAEFLQFSIDFFKKVVNAKLNSEDITIDWYRQHFMATTLPSDCYQCRAQYENYKQYVWLSHTLYSY